MEFKPNLTTWQNLKRTYKPDVKIKTKLKGIQKLPLTNTGIIDFVKRATLIWQARDWPKQKWYKGIGITFNPNYQVKDNLGQVIGSDKGQGLNSYQDSMSFNSLTQVGKYLPLIKNDLTLVRSRIAIVDGNVNVGSQGGWHQDENLFETFRVIIPCETSPEFMLQLDNKDPIHLELGFAYCWDTSKPHRLFHKKCDKKRIHLVLGYTPWFGLNTQEQAWIPNEYYQKAHPMDMFQGLKF